MKNIFLLMCIVCPLVMNAQDHTEKITKELSFEKPGTNNALLIVNISGNIEIEAYSGDKILVEATKEIRAKTETRLERGKKEIQLGIVDLADTLILYVDGLCVKFGRNSRNNKGWGYQWQDCNNDCNKDYDYTMDFRVKVPANVHVNVSTVNDGDIIVANTKGIVSANNVNGSIKLTNIIREAVAHTINGDVDIEYASNPREDCRFYTLNGDINALFQRGLAANLSFESFNGSFYTDFDQLEVLPAMVEKKSGKEGIKYKIGGNQYKIGAGGVHLDFETFNGNVYLKEKN